jgi:RNA polymerase sigma-70 factor, ECF subfamily
MRIAWDELASAFQNYRCGDSTDTLRVFESLEKALIPFFMARLQSAELAEDLTQAALMKIHLARDAYDPGRSLKTWAFTIARNTLIDHWRGTDEESESLDEGLDSEDSPGLQIATADMDPERAALLGQELKKSLASLKPMDRSIVYLSMVEGMSMAEIGEIWGLSEPATKVRAHRAYVELRKLLGGSVFL